MRNPRIGFISIAAGDHRHADFSSREGKIVDHDLIASVQKSLHDNGLDLVAPDGVFSYAHEMDEVEKKFNEIDVDLIFLNVTTWTWADEIAQFLRNMARPIVVYTVDDPKFWSAGGMFAVHGALDEIGLKHKTIYGDLAKKSVRGAVLAYAKAARASNMLRRSKYGAFGAQALGVLTGIVDPNQWLRDFGIQTGFIDMHGLVVEAEKVESNAVEDYYQTLKKEYNYVPELNRVVDRSIRVYMAVEKYIENERFDFIGIKGAFEMSDNYCSAGLALSRLADRSFPAATIGDANSALSVYFLNLLSGGTTPILSGDVVHLDFETNIVRVISDADGPRQLTARPEEEAELHMRGPMEAAAGALCVKALAKPGQVTVIRLARISGKYTLHLTEGETIAIEPDKRQSLLAETGANRLPAAYIKVEGSLDRLVENLRSEYMHMTYGKLGAELRDLCELLDIEVLEN